MKRQCCYLLDQTTKEQCPKLAEWEIYYAPYEPYDSCSTDSCSEHVGAMLTDAEEHKIFHIVQDAGVVA